MPMAIRIRPPAMPALFSSLSLVPAVFPIIIPAMQIAKVTAAIIREQTKAAAKETVVCPEGKE